MLANRRKIGDASRCHSWIDHYHMHRSAREPPPPLEIFVRSAMASAPRERSRPE